MLNETQAARLAAMAYALRPDWPQSSLLTFIQRNLSGHAYRDAAVMLAYVAADEDSKTPARVLEAGPWRRVTADQVAYRPPPFDELCATCSRPREMCERIDGADHTFISNHDYRIELARKRAKETA